MQEGIDTTPGGKLVLHLFGALAEFERSSISERTHTGLRAAKARGRDGGWPKALTDHQLKMAVRILAAPGVNVRQITEHVGVARGTLYRLLGTSLDETVVEDQGG